MDASMLYSAQRRKPLHILTIFPAIRHRRRRSQEHTSRSLYPFRRPHSVETDQYYFGLFSTSAALVSGADNTSFVDSSAGNAKLKKQTSISSKLCCPQITVLVGSGFSGLLAELSKCAVHSILVPFGNV